jgi:hypothetical protein
MSEEEWLECADLELMLNFLRDGDRTSERKLRLFACGCCRRIWDLLVHPNSRRALEVTEQFVDGLVSESVRAAAEGNAAVLLRSLGENVPAPYRIAGAAARAVPAVIAAVDYSLSTQVHRRSREPITLGLMAARGAAAEARAALAFGANPEPLRVSKAAAREQCQLLRCIVGNPFRPGSFDPAWQTPPALALARTAYEERHFEDLPLLADALEEAGCTDADLLAHLRSGGPHARGCWPLDLVLGKT